MSPRPRFTLLIQTRSTTASCIRLHNPNAQQLEEYNKQNPEKTVLADNAEINGPSYMDSRNNIILESVQGHASSGPQTKEIVYFSNHVGPIGTEMESHRGRNHEEANHLERSIKNEVKKDREENVLAKLKEFNAQGYKWDGLKKMRAKFHSCIYQIQRVEW